MHQQMYSLGSGVASYWARGLKLPQNLLKPPKNNWKSQTYLKHLFTTMSQQRLTNLCLLSIERELSDTLLSDLSPLVDKFAEMKDRKIAN